MRLLGDFLFFFTKKPHIQKKAQKAEKRHISKQQAQHFLCTQKTSPKNKKLHKQTCSYTF